MAKLTVIASRRAGLSSSELDVHIEDDKPEPGEILALVDNGSPFELVILAVLPLRTKKTFTLVCLNWLLRDGQFDGAACESRPMKAAEKRRYTKFTVA